MLDFQVSAKVTKVQQLLITLCSAERSDKSDGEGKAIVVTTAFFKETSPGLVMYLYPVFYDINT